ncbi:MAG: hypothetical protein JWQ17_2502, partial [Tardiphaga sp.]|nr:hypothetical protein [Tardiphaga sp.]
MKRRREAINIKVKKQLFSKLKRGRLLPPPRQAFDHIIVEALLANPQLFEDGMPSWKVGRLNKPCQTSRQAVEERARLCKRLLRFASRRAKPHRNSTSTSDPADWLSQFGSFRIQQAQTATPVSSEGLLTTRGGVVLGLMRASFAGTRSKSPCALSTGTGLWITVYGSYFLPSRELRTWGVAA